MIRLHRGDCREVILTLGVTVDAVVTDPPYHLTSGNIAVDFNGYGPRKDGGPYRGATNKAARAGFMGQQWDGGGIAFDPETWRIVCQALRPGGFLVAFGGTRTYHRMTCAIEDAGFVIQDCLMWLYGTGLPKRRDALKPAFEPIILAYKPGGKRTVQVDECRIACDDKTPFPVGATSGRLIDIASSKPRTEDTALNGRWPANICHDGSDEVMGLFPASESGPPRGASGTRKRQSDFRLTDGNGGYSDTGSASRFFFSAKAGVQDRWGSKHPTVKPVELIKWLVALVTPPNGTFLDPFAGSGTAAVAALRTGRNAILIEREAEYVRDIKERIAFYEGGGSHSVQAKHRNRAIDHGPLFAPQPLTPDEDALDSLQSYNVAVQEIGLRVKAGGEVPQFMLSRKANGSTE